MPLLDLVTKEVEPYEAKHQTLPEAESASVLVYLMEEHHLKETGLAKEPGWQSIVSAILNGKCEFNTRQVKALARLASKPTGTGWRQKVRTRPPDNVLMPTGYSPE